MKPSTPIIAASLLIAPLAATASPWSFRSRTPEPSHRHDHGNIRPDGDFGRGEFRPNRDYRGGLSDGRASRIEFKAQWRLRQLGYYRGPVDGDFGRGSRAALTRFQYSKGLRPTGTLTGATIRALRL